MPAIARVIVLQQRGTVQFGVLHFLCSTEVFGTYGFRSWLQEVSAFVAARLTRLAVPVKARGRT
jgi:hypothetical protein